MTYRDHVSNQLNELRRQAEEIAREKPALSLEDLQAMSAEEIQRVLHELRVHQIELEMQNEELRTAQAQIEAGRDRYFDLYDLAPVGYCTLSEQGVILEANLTAATLLGRAHGGLIKQPISRFLLKEDQDIYYLHRKKFLETGELQECDLRLVKPDGAIFWAHLAATAAQAEDGAPVCRCVISDITGRKMAEDALQRVRFSIENLSEGVFWVGETGCFTDVNAAACRKLGYTREELLTMSVADIDPCFPPEQWASHWEEMKQCDTKVLETVHRAKNGNLIPMELVVHNQSFGNQQYNCVLGRDITERKQAEEALRASEARFRHLFQSVPNIAVQGYGPDGTTRYWNEASEHLYGYTAQEAIGRNLVDLIIPTEMRGQVEQAIQQMAETGQQIPASEMSLLRKDGSRVSVFSSHATLQIPGQAPELFCIDIDITEQKRAEEALRTSERHLRSTIDGLTAHIAVLDDRGGIILTNKAYRDFAAQNGIDPRTVSEGANYLAVCDAASGINAEEATPFAEGIREVLSGKRRSFKLEYPCHSPSEDRWFIGHVTPFDGEGVSQVIVAHEVITERKQAEKDKRKADAARHLLATVIEQTSDSVIVTEPDGVILYVNPAEEKTSGYNKYELLGEKATLLTSGQTSPATFQELWQTITTGKAWSGRILSNKKDNTPMLEDVTISPVRNEEGDIINFVAIKRDVTETDFMQRQLLQAKKMEAIGQLAAGIAHEINTPMQYVQNNVTFFERAFADIFVLVDDYKELLAKQGIELSKEARKHLEEIDLDFILEEIPESISETHGGINRMVKIVSAMKEFSHPGSDNKVAIDLNRALESTITVCRNEWKYVAELETDFDPNLPMLHCLPDQLNQAVMNLIINCTHAIEETGASAPANPGRISISTSHDEDWVELRISDTGGGIPEEIRGRVFDPFFTTKVVGKGTGQGLSIVHDVVVQKHGGSIDFISAPNQGTTFILRLPRSKQL